MNLRLANIWKNEMERRAEQIKEACEYMWGIFGGTMNFLFVITLSMRKNVMLCTFDKQLEPVSFFLKVH